MATAFTPPSSSSNRHWPRIPPSRESLSSPRFSTDIGHPDTESGIPRPSFMTSVTNPSSAAPSNAFATSSKSSRFNLAAVIGFASKSKKQQPVDIQDPPEQLRTLPNPTVHTHKDFDPSSRPLVSLSRGVAAAASAAARVSTDGPLTPADSPSSFTPGISYQPSMMALTEFRDPFADTSPLSERRSSTHSERSLSKRLMQKIDSKTTKTTVRASTADSTKRKESKDRSLTLPSRGRSSKDATEGYQALRAVEPPWATSPSPEKPSVSPPRAAAHDRWTSAKSSPHGTITVRQPKSSKPGLPWSQTQAIKGQGLSQAHQRVPSSSSISHERPTVNSRPTHVSRPSSSSSIPATSPASSMFASHYSTNSISSGPRLEQLVDVRYGTVTPQTPISPSVPRTNPRPPPTTSLPPTPVTPSRPSSSSLPEHLSTEQHPLRSRSSTVASTSAVSFASSLSSLSFNSRPSPQEPPSVRAYDYPSLLNETLPVPGADEAILRRGSHSGSSSESHKDDHGLAINHTPRQTKGVLAPASQPLPSPPVTSQGISILPKRERVLSTSSSTTSDAGHPALLRKQRSFHNLSLHAPTPLKPTLRHYYSFEPAGGQPQPGSAGGKVSSPPLPPLHSPPLPPTQDLPAPPSSAGTSSSTGTGGKRGSIGKDSIASPRRKLFGASKHDRERERERKQGLDSIDTISSVTRVPGTDSAGSSWQMQTSLSSSSSSWFDDRGSEPASASSSTSPSAAHDVAQHIVPPAELLRLGATWERENESKMGLRRAKSSWGSDGSHTSTAASSSKGSLSRSTTGTGHYGASPSSTPIAASPSSPGSKLPRSASLLSTSSSTPSFHSRTHHDTVTTSPNNNTLFPTGSTSGSNNVAHHGASTGLTLPLPPPPEPEAELYTSLSPPPPRRPPRSLARAATQHVSSGLPPPPPRRRTATASGALLASSPPSSAGAAIAITAGPPPPTKGALIERKPSFLDMTSTRQSVTLDVPDLDGHDEPERDSFLELSRGMTSIETIRESMSSVDSFMQ